MKDENQKDENQKDEIVFDRRYIREKLAKLNMPNIEITSFDKGNKTKENTIYEMARVIEYTINGALLQNNVQVLNQIYLTMHNLIGIYHLIPDEDFEDAISKFEQIKSDKKKNKDLEKLTDLEF